MRIDNFQAIVFVGGVVDISLFYGDQNGSPAGMNSTGISGRKVFNHSLQYFIPPSSELLCPMRMNPFCLPKFIASRTYSAVSHSGFSPPITRSMSFKNFHRSKARCGNTRDKRFRIACFEHVNCLFVVPLTVYIFLDAFHDLTGSKTFDCCR